MVFIEKNEKRKASATPVAFPAPFCNFVKAFKQAICFHLSIFIIITQQQKLVNAK